jgi:hypothetical protein
VGFFRGVAVRFRCGADGDVASRRQRGRALRSPYSPARRWPWCRCGCRSRGRAVLRTLPWPVLRHCPSASAVIVRSPLLVQTAAQVRVRIAGISLRSIPAYGPLLPLSFN